MAEFEDIIMDQLTFKFNQPEKEIAVDIPNCWRYCYSYF